MKDRTQIYEVGIGKNVGSWEILSEDVGEKWRCRCKCGEVRILSTTQLKFGVSLQCKKCFDNKQRTPKIDMTDQTIGNVTVIEPIGGGSWRCICSCGREINVKGFNLRNSIKSGKTYRCSVCSGEAKRDKLEGQKINHWTILKYVGNGMYECKCDCSDEIHIKSGKSIKTGVSKSCGCKTGYYLKNSMIERYGDISSSNIGKNRTIEQVNALLSRDNFRKFILNLSFKPTIKELAELLSITECMALRNTHKFTSEDIITISPIVSSIEKDLYNYIKCITDINIEQSDRKILKGKELDIYVPDKQLAIEFNGTYWHSSAMKDKLYHQNKTIECAKAGIRLIHIFEYEWLNPTTQEQIKNLIRSIVNNPDTKIYAKDTEIRQIDKQESDEFLELYHLQGSVSSSIRYGMYYESNLIGVMTLGKPRFNTDYEYELIRLAWKSGISVVGGFEKLFKTFIREYTPTSIISYCDISKFTGNSYTRVGFKATSNCITAPNYIWVNPIDNKVLSRYQTQKHKLVANGFDEYGDTEDEIMENLGYLKIYDCGNLRLTWNKN